MSRFNGGEVRVELVQELRNLAEQSADVPELVELVLQRLELNERNGAFPTILYFRTAFALSLREALPLREWVGCRNRSEIDSLLIPAMVRSKSHWQVREALPT
jgi:hypothetical protein